MKNTGELVENIINFSIISNKAERTTNEDAAKGLVILEEGFFALADGLGGHGRGAEASQTAVSLAIEKFKNNHNLEKITLLSEAFEEVQEQLLIKQLKQGTTGGLKTTLTLLSISKGEAHYGYVGDTRLYMFREGKIVFRTKDHSVTEFLVATGEITESEMRNHEDRNRLLRALGNDTEGKALADITKTPVNLKGGEAFLILSDGFWEFVEDLEMEESLSHASSPEDWLKKMEVILTQKTKHKKNDNYSAIAVFYERRRKLC